MLSIFPCYSSQDKPFAIELAGFLERGARVQVFLGDGEIGSGETLVSKASDGLQADVIVLVISPDSSPTRWLRPEWEPALRDVPRRAGVKVATVLLQNCEFPGLLRRDAFFDLTQNRLAGLREIKRWLLGLDDNRQEPEFEPARQPNFHGCEAEMERLLQTLADAPGVAAISGAGRTTLALEFARQSKRDFEGLIWLSCAGESLASLAGDMASQLGMALDGDEESNLRELISFCAERRLLVILDEAEAAERLIPGGRSSTLLTKSRNWTGRDSIMTDAFDRQTPRLTPEHEKLLAAIRACGNGPFHVRLPSEVAGLDLEQAGELLRELIRCGLVIQLDVRYSRCVAHSAVPQPAPTEAMARAHARAVARRFADWAGEESECAADLPQLRRALRWALSQEDDDEAWTLACELTRRGVALLKRKRRQAEAFELLEAVSAEAEEREDRRMLDDCLRDQEWILVSWDRLKEAERISGRRHALCEDQMSFNFE